MDSFLYWYSQNNKTIIQLLCVCIGLVLIYFIYRMFFATTETASDGEGTSPITSKQLADLDKKITKMIDHQTATSKPAVFTGEASEYEASVKADALAEGASSHATAGPGQTSAENQAVIEQIQNEVAQLKKELQSSNDIITAKTVELNSAKEKIIEFQKTIPGGAVQASMDNSSGSSNVLVTGTGANDQALVAKIDELERKLQEYDIISDDIAELQSLRAENAELKSKVSSAG